MFLYDPLTLLQIAPIVLPIRQNLRYGGIERVISSLDYQLTKLGQISIVACSDDSEISGRKYPTTDRSLWSYLSGKTTDFEDLYEIHFGKVIDLIETGNIDVVHDHTSMFLASSAYRQRRPTKPILVTLHGSLNTERKRKYSSYIEESLKPNVHFNAISNAQRNEFSNIVDIPHIVYNGIDVDSFPFAQMNEKRNYLLVIGRISPEKGQDLAIKVARDSDSRLIIAGNIPDRDFFDEISRDIDSIRDISSEPFDRDYVRRVIDPVLSNGQIIYVGELNEHQKRPWFQYARVLLMPIRWNEPFGLVMVEAMATGTPVIAINRGSVPELVDDGRTGFVVDSEDEMVRSLERLYSIKSEDCRNHVKSRFSLERMSSDYLKLYREISNCMETNPLELSVQAQN